MSTDYGYVVAYCLGMLLMQLKTNYWTPAMIKYRLAFSPAENYYGHEDVCRYWLDMGATTFLVQHL